MQDSKICDTRPEGVSQILLSCTSPGVRPYISMFQDLIFREQRLRTNLYDKRDDFTFPIVNFPFICIDIPAAPPYGIYISQLIQYSRACGSYHGYQELLTLSEHPSSPLIFSGVHVARSINFCVVFCRSLFVLLCLFFWPLCCLLFFDLQILNTPLVFSNS